MFKHPKIRQAGLIVFTMTLVLILPNLGRLFS
ncbi:hypothetical protein AHFPHNDE_02900 [Pseudomonas sp. MM227]|jgi:hypothetical protein|nr:hypothetical protein AHFPHNDE_02900 [Pseudomonas sp. MM227]SEE52040.1 hypothetical protein SAMN05216510_2963 [Pseudomonas coleopterorum]